MTRATDWRIFALEPLFGPVRARHVAYEARKVGRRVALGHEPLLGFGRWSIEAARAAVGLGIVAFVAWLGGGLR